MNKYLQTGIVTFLLMLLVLQGQAQAIGNEWINYAQQYYKIPVAQTGFHRITKQQLQVAGFPVNSVNPRAIQLFHRGIEQAIVVEGENDGFLHDQDYIEFYGKQNDGTLDARLYQPQSAQSHQISNLFSDTTAYFLTWRIDGGVAKRISSYTDLATVPLEPFHWAEATQLRRNSYSKGHLYDLGENTAMSYFDVGEGWFGDITNRTVSRLDSVTGIINMLSTGPDPKLEIMLAGRNRNAHRVQVFIGKTKAEVQQWVSDHTNVNIQRAPFDTISFSSFNTIRKEYTIPKSYISASGELFVIVRPVGVNNVADAISIAYLKVKWPQTFNVSGVNAQYFQLNSNTSGSSGIELVNAVPEGMLYDITNISAIRRIGGTFSNNRFRAVVQNTTINRNLYYRAASLFITPIAIERAEFRRITPASHNYLIVSHRSLMQPDGTVDNPVKAYASYRASAQGGGHDTLVVEINQLYNQFNYGEASPLAIQNFVSYMHEAGKEKYLFLIGKGVLLSSKANALYAQRNLVPTYGVPASDMMYSAGLNGEPNVPAMATGRLAALTPDQVTAYLNKVKEQESLGYNELWRKNVLQLSGGTTQSEQRDFRNYIFNYQQVLEKPFFGAHVENKFRRTTNIVEIINVSPEVNRGVTLLTLFGHSSSTTNDMEIGKVSDPAAGYDNPGKYTSILMNGCSGGMIFGTSTGTLSEDWILTPNKGAIVFLAHTDDGIPYALNRYSENMHKFLFQDPATYGTAFGKAMVKSIELYRQSIYAPNEIDRAIFQQFTLHGDPAVRIFDAKFPDYRLRNGDITVERINDQQVTANSDSIQLSIIVSNLGKAVNDSVQIQLKRVFADNSEVSFGPFTYKPVYRQDTLFVTLPNKYEHNAGVNKFIIEVDPENKMQELKEDNNSVVFEYYIPVSGVMTLFPKEFSIVNTRTVLLQGQSSNLLEQQRSYVFELDTLISFNSSIKQTYTIEAGGLPQWNATLPGLTTGKDSVVYYWRVKFAQAQVPQDTIWSQSSFIYINLSSDGWAQGRIPQHRRNKIDKNIVRNENANMWEFISVSTHIETQTQGAKVPSTVSVTNLEINNTEMLNGFYSCGSNSVRVVAFKRNSLQPYRQIFPNFDQNACGRNPSIINTFSNAEITSTTNPKLDGFIDFVGEGDYVLLISNGTLSYPNWSETTKQKLASLGVDLSKFSGLTAGQPYIMFGRKGTTQGSAIEVYADPNLRRPDGTLVPLDSQIISLNHQFTGKADTASIVSSRIGPATAWQSLFYDWASAESTEKNDKVRINVIGTDLQGRETLLFSNVSRSFSLASVNASEYPYLKLQAELKDSVHLTPPQLRYWLVNYQGVPEGIIHAEMAGQSTYTVADKQEGETFQLPFVFKNITQRSFPDSVVVRYSLTNLTSRQKEENTVKLRPLPGQDTLKLEVPVNTMGRSGRNMLQVFFNPHLQPEEYYENNVLEVPFNVGTDKVNPILEVAFDGVRIMDGDIVSPSPMITVRLIDENRYMLKRDTTGMKLFLNCKGCNPEQISLSSPEVSYIPATGDKNEFIINYQPKHLEDGIYTLTVQGSDASGNFAGNNDYKVNFEVINESTVTHFYPYPNPFTTTTRFAFTLTGANVPDDIRIQIMTVTGKVIREIKKHELGPIRIGHNLTTFAWDGTDEFGDKLANGVYLYRVLMKSGNENTIKHRATAADDMFKKNVGKIYILR